MLYTGVSGNDPKNDFEIFLKNYAWLLAVIVVVVILLTILIIFVIRNKSKGNKKVTSEDSVDEWIESLGGLDNIVDVSSMGSRLSVKLKNKDLVNRDKLTELGVNNVVTMSDKITLVTNLDNQKLVENMKNRQQN